WSADGATIYAPAVAPQAFWQLWAFDARTGKSRQLTSGAAWYNQWNLSSTVGGDLIASTRSTDAAIWITDGAGHARVLPDTKELTLLAHEKNDYLWRDLVMSRGHEVSDAVLIKNVR